MKNLLSLATILILSLTIFGQTQNLKIEREILKHSTVGFSFTERRSAGSTNSVGTLDGRFQIDKNKPVAVQTLTV